MAMTNLVTCECSHADNSLTRLPLLLLLLLHLASAAVTAVNLTGKFLSTSVLQYVSLHEECTVRVASAACRILAVLTSDIQNPTMDYFPTI